MRSLTFGYLTAATGSFLKMLKDDSVIERILAELFEEKQNSLMQMTPGSNDYLHKNRLKYIRCGGSG